MERIKGRLRGFITKFLRNDVLQDNQDIFALGFVNSLFAMQLVLFIEQEFGITVENEDLDMNNFRTIDAMAQFVVQKQTPLVEATHEHTED